MLIKNLKSICQELILMLPNSFDLYTLKISILLKESDTYT